MAGPLPAGPLEVLAALGDGQDAPHRPPEGGADAAQRSEGPARQSGSSVDEVLLSQGRLLQKENLQLRARLRELGRPVPDIPSEEKALAAGHAGPASRSVRQARDFLRSRHPGVAEAVIALSRAETADDAEAAAERLEELRYRVPLAPQPSALGEALRAHTVVTQQARLVSILEAEVSNLRDLLVQRNIEADRLRREAQDFRKMCHGRTPQPGMPPEVQVVLAQAEAKRAEVKALRGAVEEGRRRPDRWAALGRILGTPQSRLREILKRWNALSYWSIGQNPMLLQMPGEPSDVLDLERTGGTLSVIVTGCKGLANQGTGVFSERVAPFVLLHVASQRFHTAPVEGNLNPVWTEANRFKFHVAQRDQFLRLAVLSKGRYEDSLLGSAVFDFRELTPGVWQQCAGHLDGAGARAEVLFRACFQAQTEEQPAPSKAAESTLGSTLGTGRSRSTSHRPRRPATQAFSAAASRRPGVSTSHAVASRPDVLEAEDAFSGLGFNLTGQGFFEGLQGLREFGADLGATFVPGAEEEEDSEEFNVWGEDDDEQRFQSRSQEAEMIIKMEMERTGGRLLRPRQQADPALAAGSNARARRQQRQQQRGRKEGSELPQGAAGTPRSTATHGEESPPVASAAAAGGAEPGRPQQHAEAAAATPRGAAAAPDRQATTATPRSASGGAGPGAQPGGPHEAAAVQRSAAAAPGAVTTGEPAEHQDKAAPPAPEQPTPWREAAE